MDIKLHNTQTGVTISQEVISSIANEAVREIGGIYSLAPVPQKKFNLLDSMNSAGKGKMVKISFVSEAAHIDIGITVNLNHKIREVAEQVQAEVKNAVQDMTGITVSKVNVFVAGIHVKNEN